MKIDLSDFFRKNEKTYHISGKLDNSISDLEFGEFIIIQPVTYDGDIYKVGHSYEIAVNISFGFESQCARCTRPVTRQMETTLLGRLEKQEYGSSENEDDIDTILLHDNFLDIDKYILMEIASSLPMKVLCGRECKGICPQCGKNLNEETCDCREETIDPRFEKLKDLFDD